MLRCMPPLISLGGSHERRSGVDLPLTAKVKKRVPGPMALERRPWRRSNTIKLFAALGGWACRTHHEKGKP